MKILINLIQFFYAINGWRYPSTDSIKTPDIY